MSAISDLIIEQGRIAAARRQAQGQTWGQAIAGLGQIPLQVQQQRQAQQEREANRALLQSREAREAAGAQREDAVFREQVKARQQAQAGEWAMKLLASGADKDPARVQAEITHMRGTLWDAEETQYLLDQLAQPDGAAHVLNSLAPLRKAPEPYTLGRDDIRFGGNNEEVARGVKSPPPRGAAGTMGVDPNGIPIPNSQVPDKPAAPPDVGSFEDYVRRSAAAMGKPVAQLTPGDIEAARKKYQQADDRPRVSITTGDATNAKEFVSGMVDGTLPPQLPGRASAEYTAIMAEAHRHGYDLAGAVTDWTATQKHIATMNGAQQLRLNQAINALPDMLDKVDALASQWKGGRFPILNSANLKLAKGGAYGQDVASIANQLDAQIADVTADLGNVYMGGNSPTDHALGLAGKSLNGAWSEKVLHDMVGLAKKNVTIRQNSIKNTGVAGASAGNPYAPPAAAGAPAAPIKVGGFTVVVE